MKVADINVTRGDSCPNEWLSYHVNNQSYCTGGKGAGCYSANFSTSSVKYNKVCGKAVGYQKGSTDAFYPSARSRGDAYGYTPITASNMIDGCMSMECP